MTVRVGVIGTGMIGAEHVTRLASKVVGSTVTAVFDVAAQRARQVATSVGATPRPSWEALVSADDVDAVVIASPGDLHPDQAIACIEAGKPVLCEKPLAVSTDEAWRVVQAEVAAARRYVQVGFMRRFDVGYGAVKRVISDGSIGEPLLAHAVHRNPSVPESFRGEMSLTDSVVHEFDTFRWLFESEIAAVTVLPVKKSSRGSLELRDPQIVIFEMSGGEVVTVESFVNCQYGYDVRCEVVGAIGTVSLENPRTAVLTAAGRRGEGVPADWRDRFAPAYTQEMQAWIHTISTGQADSAFDVPTAWDGYAASAVAESAVISFAKGERVDVELPDKPSLYA